jgi:glycerophosphoryl diester phosphodiesterase
MKYTKINNDFPRVFGLAPATPMKNDKPRTGPFCISSIKLRVIGLRAVVALIGILTALGIGSTGTVGAATTTTAVNTTRQPFLLIAHRGASMRAPENTLAAFRIAKQLGVTDIETDVQLTTDNVLVLCHDNTLTRYKLGDWRVEDLPYATADVAAGTAAASGAKPALDAMDFGAWFSKDFAGTRIATLPQLLDAHASDFMFHIELKGAHPRLAAETIALLETRGLASRCVLTSFSIKQLRRARAASPGIRLAWLVRAIDDTVLRTAAEPGLKLHQLCPHASFVTATPEAVARALQIVPEVRAWGCPRKPDAARAAIRAVQAAGCVGITADDPGLLDAADPAQPEHPAQSPGHPPL